MLFPVKRNKKDKQSDALWEAMSEYDPMTFKCERELEILERLDDAGPLTEKEAIVLAALKMSKLPHEAIEETTTRSLGFDDRDYYFDWDGEPIKMWECSFKRAYLPIHVGDDMIDGRRVSTVWLGYNHGFGHGVVIFETMIFQHDDDVEDNEDLDEFQQRYETYEEARHFHLAICSLLRGKNFNGMRDLDTTIFPTTPKESPDE